jgi:hypothetical protein
MDFDPGILGNIAISSLIFFILRFRLLRKKAASKPSQGKVCIIPDQPVAVKYLVSIAKGCGAEYSAECR